LGGHANVAGLDYLCEMQFLMSEFFSVIFPHQSFA